MLRLICMYLLCVACSMLLLDKYLILQFNNIDTTKVNLKIVRNIVIIKYSLIWFITLPHLLYKTIKQTKQRKDN